MNELIHDTLPGTIQPSRPARSRIHTNVASAQRDQYTARRNTGGSLTRRRPMIEVVT